MVKGVILAFRAASNARDVNCVVFTGAGDKAFCTGGNTKEYAEYYAGHPQEYRQYMRLFNDMVSAILACDKPVICRVNGMRIGGGQEIGMACDFSVAQDLARFGQAGPKHGSAPIGGATDFLPVMVGAERAMAACVLCEPFSAHKAYQMGVLTDIVPALKVDGKFIANPLVETQRAYDEFGRVLYGEFKSGPAAREAKALLAAGSVDLSLLDAKVEELCAKMLLTFPDCTTKTLEELRKPKLEAWNRNKENSRAWLALEHDDRGARRLHRLQRGHRRTTARSTSCCCARSSPPARAGSGRCTTRSSRRTRADRERSGQGMGRAGRRAAAPAARPAEGQHRRCRDDRRAARRARAGQAAIDLARRAARCRGAELQLRRERRGAPRRRCAGDAGGAACADHRDARISRCRSWSPCAASAWAAGSRSRSPAGRSSRRPTRSSASPR